MPSKNAYVAESDLPMFKRASRLADGMSAVVAAGSRLYLAQHGKNQERVGMETIGLRVNDDGVVRTKRFSGRLLLHRKQNERLRIRTSSVYATARGQYAVHIRDEPDWSRMPAEGDNSPLQKNQETQGSEWRNTKHRKPCIFRDIIGMRGEMPDYLVDETERTESQPTVEDLGIRPAVPTGDGLGALLRSRGPRPPRWS